MKNRASSKTRLRPMAFHQKLVDQMVRNVKPAGWNIRPVTQWFFWLGASLTIMFLFWMRMGLQENFWQAFLQIPHFCFILTAFAGASLAAWEAIASGIPGRQTSYIYRVLEILILIALVSIPFFFFARVESMNMGKAIVEGFGCEEGVAFTGLIPWIFMGWILSRNATFHPWWTGLWSGVSAFLMGTITLQLHCPDWNMDHVLMAHLFPAAVGTLLASLLGSFWFSRWKK